MSSYKNKYSTDEQLKIDSEFSRIQVKYLDHAGTTLYSEAQVKSNFERLSENLFCNPHTSKETEDLIDQVRFNVLKHFNTNASKYNLVFTSGTTSSLKLIAECFNFELTNLDGNANEKAKKGEFVYVKDNHTSVLGMREVVQTDRISYIERDELLDGLNVENVEHCDDPSSIDSNSLLVFAAQCNFNGFKIPLEIVEKIHKNGIPSKNPLNNTKWFICLDAASYAATNFLDLSKYQPNFVCVSFYKLFGYPTGLGALLVRKDSEYVINKKYYGGGTVKIAMSELNWHRKRETFHQRLEDGTIPFLSIISLLSGFQTIQRLVPPTTSKNSMERIAEHVFDLAAYLYNELKGFTYESNGKPVVKIYHDTEYKPKDEKIQGGIVNFNVLREDGSYVGFAEVGHLALINNIYLRTGCFCNPGTCQRHLRLSNDELKKQYKAGHICGDSNDLVDGVPTGSVRISCGYMTKKSDVDAVIEMIRSCYMTKSNIVDQLQRTKSPSDNHSKTIQLKMICVFPVKSCGSMKITTEWPLSSKGLLYDRGWMIITETGTAYTQKNNTNMCMIRPEINLITKTMTLHYPKMKSIIISLDNDLVSLRKSSATICQTKVCGDRVEGFDCGDEVAEWLENALGTGGLRLIRQTEDENRISRKTLSNITLTNQEQFLLINRTSAHWLAEKVDDWIVKGIFPENHLDNVIDRFRANLIIESDHALEEIHWKGIECPGIGLKAEGPCTRCQMICIDQNTGIKTTEPLKTIGREFDGKMKFGLYLSQEREYRGNQIIRCGDWTVQMNEK